MFSVRTGVSADYAQIEHFLEKITRLVLRVPWEQLPAVVAQHSFFLCMRDRDLLCVCGVFIEPATVAQIRVFGLDDTWALPDVLPRLLPVIAASMRAKKVDTLVFIGVENWLIDGLLAHGFHLENRVITLQKTDFGVPSAGNAGVRLVPVSPADFAAIVAIDRAAFAPVWQCTQESLTRIYADLPYFVAAQVDGRIVGYAYANLIGRHGHLSRLAVYPQWQGRQIGVRLLADVIRFCRERRVFGITLNTQQDNHRSRRLYEWFGFKSLGVEAQVLFREIPAP